MPVFITGMGVISALGGNCGETQANLSAGRLSGSLCEAAPRQLQFVAPLSAQYDSHGESYRAIDLLEQALDEALLSAGLDPAKGGALDKGCAVCIGSASACYLNDLWFHRKLHEGDFSQERLKKYFACNPSEFVRRKLRLSGAALTVGNACASGTDAMGLGMALIRSGRCEQAIVGGTEELHQVSASGFYSLGVTSATRCQPFDKNRKGLNLGEGAGVMLLESAASLLRRHSATPFLELAGYGNSNDAYHVTQPCPEGSGLERALRQALDSAGIVDPDAVDFVNAHGTGTIHNDLSESRALFRVFGKSCRYHSTKGLTGHTLGAAGALEAIFSALMLLGGRVCASHGFVSPDDAMPLKPQSVASAVAADSAVSSSLAFGGCNSALVLRRLKGLAE
ncbi:MAG: hypothetical protein A2X49_16465 [Lentisphaerae bacterium GWF2_52_8]|nr:MAG: hypothetical protein A2X49_16465 [Lentisphaerae bacterium GWF2_52_8]